jgi:two-component sensor histidine kinase/PAS domain-containing protein
LAHFYGSGDELRNVLVPYFKAGLENNERCRWVTGDAFSAEQARAALRAALPDLDKRERVKQIEISNSDERYAAGGKLRPRELLSVLLQREQDAVGLGYAGLRTNGNCSWVSRDQWADFLEYETLVQQGVRGRRMICMCSYRMEELRDGANIEIIERHDMAMPPVLRSSSRDSSGAPAASFDALQERAAEHTLTLRKGWERQKLTSDLPMAASEMGTWRLTLADNICVYDKNAQRLYGLTEERFLLDEAGVKSKFHPDDLELMGSRSGKALDPRGDGRYDVHYRVKQLNGGWRWLSAWGFVEFEGDGPGRKAVAIAGASRDLTELKQAEEVQRLLLDELNHRVKNTLATLEAIAARTVQAARDLPSARESLDHRIGSMARAHELLMLRAGSGASLRDVVMRALDAFSSSRVKISGDEIDVSPKHALALSLALHELATNAAKYGALSCSEGKLDVKWAVKDGTLHLDWEESGGPPVSPPTQIGFGARLLVEILSRYLDGDVTLNYEVSGVRCSIATTL